MHALDALTHLGVCKGELLSRKKKQTDKLSTFCYCLHSYHQSDLCNKQIYNIYSKHHMQKLRNACPAN